VGISATSVSRKTDPTKTDTERMNDDEFAAVLADLQEREPLFHRGQLSRAQFEALTAPDFWEVGASGARYEREYVWSVLEERNAAGGLIADDHWRTDGQRVRPLSADVFLLTYRLQQADRLSSRMTIWDRTGGTWKAIYHQGTLIPPE
jgi:hypothetical protein